MSEDSSSVEMVDLSPGLLGVAAALLAAYMAGRSNASTEECEQALRRLLDFPGALFVLARRSGIFCGFISLNWGFSTTKGRPILRVQDLYTLPEHRGLGVARVLLWHAVVMGCAAGANRLQLATDTDNVRARSLYESFGFEWFSQKEIYMLFLQSQG